MFPEADRGRSEGPRREKDLTLKRLDPNRKVRKSRGKASERRVFSTSREELSRSEEKGTLDAHVQLSVLAFEAILADMIH